MRDIMLILHFIGLAMGLGTAFAHIFIGFSASKMSTEEAIKFKLQTLVLGRMGSMGLILLVISGIYLLIPYWNSLLLLPLLMLKLFLVIILIVLIAMISSLGHRALIQNPEIQFRKMALLGKIALTVTIVILVLAVMVFH